MSLIVFIIVILYNLLICFLNFTLGDPIQEDKMALAAQQVEESLLFLRFETILIKAAIKIALWRAYFASAIRRDKRIYYSKDWFDLYRTIFPLKERQDVWERSFAFGWSFKTLVDSYFRLLVCVIRVKIMASFVLKFIKGNG